MRLSIRHYEFDIREPYQEGDVMTAQEANILNRLRIQQIRDTWHRRIPDSPLYEADVLAEIREEFAEYDARYTLQMPAPFRPQWTLDDEIRLMRSEGYKRPDFEQVARRRYKARLTGVPGPVGDYL